MWGFVVKGEVSLGVPRVDNHIRVCYNIDVGWEVGLVKRLTNTPYINSYIHIYIHIYPYPHTPTYPPTQLPPLGGYMDIWVKHAPRKTPCINCTKDILPGDRVVIGHGAERIECPVNMTINVLKGLGKLVENEGEQK